MANENKIVADREILTAANQKGALATFFAFFRLSGPGWLQAAITLGGGSLGSALYLGVLSGTSMLWLQMVAIIAGVIMLSAIAYVTLSTGKRPYQAINEYINPVLGVGWIVATVLANMIWIMPQFSLCFDAINTNFANDTLKEKDVAKYGISIGLFVLAGVLVFLSSKKGLLTKLFDLFLKLVIGVIIVCFVAVVVILFRNGEVDWSTIFNGLVPDLRQWSNPSEQIQMLIESLSEEKQKIWTDTIVSRQREVMISTAATAVGLNMTFLLPYSLLARGWDKPFRGLARFDLVTGMAIPFILVTSCIVIASAHSFHGKTDEALLSKESDVVKTSMFFKGAAPIIRDNILKKDDQYLSSLKSIQDLEADIKVLKDQLEKNWFDKELTGELAEKNKQLASETNDVVSRIAPDLSDEEKILATVLVKPNANQLAKSLQPFLGDRGANLVFGAGALAMGFSTIIILMMINGYAIREMFGKPESQSLFMTGAVAAGIVGICYPLFWGGVSKTWLIIMASVFGAMLLPIAYIAFLLMMNNSQLMGDNKPKGVWLVIWNVLMTFGVIVALAAAVSAISIKLGSEQGMFVLGAAITFVILAIFGFSARYRKPIED
ncbi:divalent metal cation transporter [Pirellulaceae bacterium]|jgi:Mn2+/Fe2+ NRAMP family transporter|nr:divalent metal cation transporter [Pirellulaceae bacterium]